VLKVIKLAWEACRKIGLRSPDRGGRPQSASGESGMFGREEIEEIIPAIEEQRR